ncbi:hypothetical protein COLO4_00298 [Corchorus olitorius]|uniref:Uncharacterized protein n=1 Tax=Corchorus olitorius TaxID=93759 RepID=A0A1R3L431_9ROSI|nr:hypothetical protein COLO4_00298 [Corchorus olitorius]
MPDRTSRIESSPLLKGLLIYFDFVAIRISYPPVPSVG